MAKVEFRTGFREVPDHLAALMRDLDTYKMSYEEAVEKANWKMTADYLNRVQHEMVRDSLKKGLL